MKNPEPSSSGATRVRVTCMSRNCTHQIVRRRVERSGCHGETQQWDETQIHRHWRFNHQYLGGLDEKQKKNKGKDASEREMRECGRDPLRTFLLHTSISRECPCTTIVSTFRSLFRH